MMLGTTLRRGSTEAEPVTLVITRQRPSSTKIRVFSHIHLQANRDF
jgi:hypothetical protein